MSTHDIPHDTHQLPYIHIRKVNPERDAGNIAALYNRFILNSDVTFETESVSADEMKSRIAAIASVYPYLVCEADGSFAGYACVHEWNPKQAYAHSVETSIYLSEEYTRKGIGSMLLSRLEDECRKRGFKTLVALVTADNTSSCRFHEASGYERAGLLRNIGCKFGKLLDVAIYQHILN